jgi:hypothetical protein
MIEIILLGYALTILIFFGWALKGAEQYSTKLTLSFLALSLAWPIVLVVYLLDNKGA